MKSLIVVGLQWGDEGKGKIVDAIAGSFDYVVRWNGGNNAGHTVVIDGERYPLSLVPSGVLQRKKLLIGQGVVITPDVLLREIESLSSRGYPVDLMIDPRVHIVMSYHKLMDAANEAWKGKNATGSLHLGIGYCYEDRNNRTGVRFEDLIRPALLRKKVEMYLPLKLAILKKAYGLQEISLTVDSIVKQYQAYGKKLEKYLGDVSALIYAKRLDKAFLFEQAHGTMLDPVFGTYPYTVAPPTISSAVFPCVGIPAIPTDVLGVVKAYTTRVGNGPFPTELMDATGEEIRANGHEFGTVSKRPRRCGWLDIAQLRYAVRLNGCTSLAITKIDVLSFLSTIMICSSYSYKGKILQEFPSEIAHLSDCKPVYTSLSGWKKDISAIHTFVALPKEAKAYIRFVEKELGLPVTYISVGADRQALISV